MRPWIGLHKSCFPFHRSYLSRVLASDRSRNSGFPLTLHCRRDSRPRFPGCPPARPWRHGSSLLLGAADLGMASGFEYLFVAGFFEHVNTMDFSVGGAWLELIPGPCRPGGSRNRGSSRGSEPSASTGFPAASPSAASLFRDRFFQAFDELMQACVSHPLGFRQRHFRRRHSSATDSPGLR